MRASRALAYASDSRTTMPAPSPHTKPSRFASNGRMAFAGSSLRVDIAFIEQKPAIVSGTTMASAPPAIITSASPRWMILKESPMAWSPVAHAVTTDELGPLAPARFLLVDEGQRVEVPHLAGDAGRIVGGVELGDRAHARAPLHQRGPEFVRGVAHWREGAEPRHDDPLRGHRLRVVLDVLDRVADGHDLLGILVGDLDVEVLLEGHDELHRIERVGPQVLDELRRGGDVVLLHPELLHDDLLHLLIH